MQALQEKNLIITELQAKNKRREQLIGKFEEMVKKPGGDLWPERLQTNPEKAQNISANLSEKTIPALKFLKDEADAEIEISQGSKTIQALANKIDKENVGSNDTLTTKNRKDRLDLQRGLLALEEIINIDKLGFLSIISKPLSLGKIHCLHEDPASLLEIFITSRAKDEIEKKKNDKYLAAKNLPKEWIGKYLAHRFAEEAGKIKKDAVEQFSKEQEIFNHIQNIIILKMMRTGNRIVLRKDELTDLLLSHFGLEPQVNSKKSIKELTGMFSLGLPEGNGKGGAIPIEPKDQKEIERLYFENGSSPATVRRELGNRTTEGTIKNFLRNKIKDRLKTGGIANDRKNFIWVAKDEYETLLNALLEPELSLKLIWMGLDQKNSSLFRNIYTTYRDANYRKKADEKSSTVRLIILAAIQTAVDIEKQKGTVTENC